jgi:Domain of unknown function (DUF4390)
MQTTTVSTTFSWPSLETINTFVLSLLLALQIHAAKADASITARDLTLDQVNEVYTFSGGFDVRLGAQQEEVLAGGVPLYFVADFDVVKPRWWWWSDQIASVSRSAKLQYNILLRQYSVTVGSRQKTFDSLPRALEMLGDLSGWQVLDRRILKSDETYVARVRFRMDISQLPRPLQVNALASNRWELDSGRLEWFLKP